MLEDAADVQLDRAFRDVQATGDQLVGQAAHQQPQHLALTLRQRGEAAALGRGRRRPRRRVPPAGRSGRRRTVRIARDARRCRQWREHREHLGRHVHATARHQLERTEEDVALGRLGDEAHRALVDRRDRVVRAARSRHHDDRQRRMAQAHFLQRLHALHARQAEIEEQQIEGVRRVDRAEALRQRGGAADRERGVDRVQCRRDGVPHHRMVVDHQEAHGHGRCRRIRARAADVHGASIGGGHDFRSIVCPIVASIVDPAQTSTYYPKVQRGTLRRRTGRPSARGPGPGPASSRGGRMIGRTAAPAWTGDRGDAQEEVLRLLMLQTRRAPIGAFVMVPFLASLVDPHVDRPGLLVWAVCAFAVIALRAGFAVWWLRTDRRPPASFTRPFMIVTAIASGAMAGLFSLVFLPQAPPMEQGLIVGSMLAWAAGSLATMSHLPMQFYGFIPCLALPLVYSSAASGFAMPYVVALLVVMFSIIVVASVRDYGAMVHETARRRFENQALIEQLSAQTQTALEAQATAEEAVRLKSRFLAATSHDLRQPVTALSVLTGALLLRPLDPVAAAHAQRIDTAVQSLDGLLGALLDPSRLDADEIRAEMTAFSIDALGERVAADLRPVAEAAGIAFTVQCAGGTVVSDPVLLERVLRNLLQNAVRYTPAGSVRLRIARRADDIVIEVRDTGIGIPQEFRERVFEEYFQVSNPGRNRRRGLGLGLSIVRRLCRLLGARIALESEPGRGSVFRVELPIGTAPAAVARAAVRK
ncbi:MAG: HAMP domain-containing histidine kinase, partial [Burkholderiaceae bacterium]